MTDISAIVSNTGTAFRHLPAATQSVQIDELARRLVSQDVRYCVSGLIATLMADAFNEQAIMGEHDAYTLATRAPDAADFEDAARENADFHIVVTKQASEAGGLWHWAATNEEGEPEEGRAASEVDAWGEAFAYVQADLPEGSEIFEYWLVTDDLARRLKAQGESIANDVAGMTVWGRATTGQAIYADAVIQRISRDILEA